MRPCLRFIILSFLLFRCADGAIELFAIKEQRNILKNQLLNTFVVFPKEYEITFEVCLTSFTTFTSSDPYSTYWADLFDFTTGNTDYDATFSYSYRVISMGFDLNGKMIYHVAVNGIVYNEIYQKTFTTGCKQFRINQLLYHGYYNFTLNIDGTNIFSIMNTGAKEFNNVKMYFSNPWYIEQPGYFKNLLITKGCSESYFYCKPQLNVQVNCQVVEDLLNISFQVSYTSTDELAYNVVWEFFLPLFVMLKSEVTPLNVSKVTANSLKYTIFELKTNGIKQTITTTIINTKCLFGGSYTIDIPVKFYFENSAASSWKSFHTIRKVLKENCKSPVIPIDKNHATEYYGRGIYWDDVGLQVYLCINQHVAKVQDTSCYFSKDYGLNWQAMDVRIGAVLGHDLLSRELYAVHRNQKLYLMFHNIFKKWLAVTNDDFKTNVIHKLNWTRLKSFVGVFDDNITFNTNQWMGNGDGLYFKNLTDNAWIQRFKWNV